MADFPYTNFKYGYRFIPRSGIAMNESVSGVEDVRDLYGTRKTGTYTGIPMNDSGGYLTAAQLASLISHYEGDYDNEFNFTDPITGDTITVIYGDPGIGQPVKVGPDAYAVTVTIERHKLQSTSDYLLLEQSSTDALLTEAGDTIELESS